MLMRIWLRFQGGKNGNRGKNNIKQSVPSAFNDQVIEYVSTYIVVVMRGCMSDGPPALRVVRRRAAIGDAGWAQLRLRLRLVLRVALARQALVRAFEEDGCCGRCRCAGTSGLEESWTSHRQVLVQVRGSTANGGGCRFEEPRAGRCWKERVEESSARRSGRGCSTAEGDGLEEASAARAVPAAADAACNAFAIDSRCDGTDQLRWENRSYWLWLRNYIRQKKGKGNDRQTVICLVFRPGWPTKYSSGSRWGLGTASSTPTKRCTTTVATKWWTWTRATALHWQTSCFRVTH